MKITTCYVMKIRRQLDVTPVGHGKGVKGVIRSRSVDKKLMDGTADICLQALTFCVNTFLQEWSWLKNVPASQKSGRPSRKSTCDNLIHTTKTNKAKYPEFDARFSDMTSYMCRCIIADALGMVSSYFSNWQNWKVLPPDQRGDEPKIGLPSRYELTFYDQERDLGKMDEGIIGLKLYENGCWVWKYFTVSPADARYLKKLCKNRKLLSPTVEKKHNAYYVRFAFEEEKDLVPADDPLSYKVLAVDLGINAPASWCSMTADGTVHAKGVIHLACEEGRLNRLINRKRMYQQAGKKSHSIYRQVKEANRQLSIATAKAIVKTALEQGADCIVFEHLDSAGKIKGKRYKERIHLWRKNDVQKRVEAAAHRNSMRVSRICAWGTSKWAFDGSGKTDRRAVYIWKHGKKWYNYSVCRFPNGKIYNCDLSASMNIGARFFLREYAKSPDCPDLLPTPQRTLSTLLLFVNNGLPTAA